MVTRARSDRPLPPRGEHGRINCPEKIKGRMREVALLNIGDSIFFPHINQKHLSSGLARLSKKFNRKYTTRSYEENGIKGVCVWRLPDPEKE